MSYKPSQKKPYEAPTVERVRLVVKDAVLAQCHSSPNLNPRTGAMSCRLVPACFAPPVDPPPQ